LYTRMDLFTACGQLSLLIMFGLELHARLPTHV
jgi:hypothetical protein